MRIAEYLRAWVSGAKAYMSGKSGNDFCKLCFNHGWLYYVDPEGKAEDVETCNMCQKGQALGILPLEAKQTAFNDFLASLPEPDSEEEEE